MTWREEPPRRAADPEPSTTPLPVVTARTRPAGGHRLNDPSTSKIGVPNQRTESPLRASVESFRSALVESSRRASAESIRSAPTDSSRSAPTESSRSAPTDSSRSASADSTRSAPAESARQASAESPRSAPTDSPRSALAETSRSARSERRRGSRASAPPKPRARVLVTSVLIGALVSVALGVYGRMHAPTGYAVNVAGFSSPGYVKAWLASVAVAFAVLQPISAAVMYRGIRGRPRWVAFLHRWSGRIAVLVSIPVAMHCLYAFGFQSESPRVLAHSLAGCLFYGAFTTKMLSLARPRTPKWAVPLFGGLVFTILVALWLSSALWLFGRQGVHI